EPVLARVSPAAAEAAKNLRRDRRSSRSSMLSSGERIAGRLHQRISCRVADCQGQMGYNIAMTALEERLIDEAHRLGFALAGIAPPGAQPRASDATPLWRGASRSSLDQERETPGDKPLASDATPLWRGASRSFLDDKRETPRDKPVASTGHIARYARGADYHL